MGKPLLIAVAALTLLLPITLFSVDAGSSESDERLNDHAAKVLAREVALTGLGDAEKAVFDSYAASNAYTGETTWTTA